jgi:uncharacterized protein YybS (DUF2232 family)
LNLEFKNKRSEIIIVLLISTILALFGLYYFQFIIFLYPVLFIILGVRHGLKYTLISLLISSVLVSLIADVVLGVLMFIAFMPLTIIIINMIVKRKNPIETLIYSTITFLGSVLLIIFLVNINGVSIIGQLKMNITQAINNQLKVLEQLNLTKEQMTEIRNLHRDYLEIVLAMIPSIIMIFSLVVSYINYLLSTSFLRKLGHAIVFVPKFSNFKLPRNIFLGLGIMFFATFLLNRYNLFNSYDVIINLIVLSLFIFFVQGISVIDYKLKYKNIRTVWRIFILLLIFEMMPIAGFLVIILGLFDAIFDFRKLTSSN